MKKNIKIFMYNRLKKKKLISEPEAIELTIYDYWPNLEKCVVVYYKTHPGMKEHYQTKTRPIKFKYTEKFIKSLVESCKTDAMKLQFIDGLTKLVYKIPSPGLHDQPIKEKKDLRRFYVSYSWRVYYRRKKDYIVLEEFYPHNKPPYIKRS